MTTTKIPAEFLEAITGSEITDGGIGTADIADLGITTAKIANNAITAAKLPDNVITATHIPNGLITGTHIAGTTITATQIANNAVGTDQLAGIARGKIIYGDSNGDPQLLTIGSNGTALVSDGTDISWGSAGETNRLPLAGGTMTGNLQINSTGNLLTLNATSGVAYQKFNENGTGRFFLATLNGADGLAFVDADGSTERMRIDANGNVGIGQAPNMKLNILHADQDGLRFNTANNAETFIDFGDTDDNDIGRISYDHADNSMSFRTNNSNDRLVIDSSGNVGIGITDPDHKLEIGGAHSQLKLTDTDDDNYVQMSYSSDYLAFRMNSTTSTPVLALNDNDKVGIGVTAPAQKLEVAGRIRATTDPTFEAYEASGKRGGMQWDSTNDFLKIFSVGGDIVFESQNNSGNVGIGTTSPAAPLDVVSNSSAVGIELRGRSADNIGQLTFESNDSGTTYSQLQSLSTELKVKTVANIPMSFHTNNTERMRLHTSGKLSVTATGAIAMDVQGEGGSHGLAIGGNDAGFGYIGHRSSGSYDLCIISSGNVGIGNASPAQKLHVGGNVRFSTTTVDGNESRMDFTAGGASDDPTLTLYRHDGVSASVRLRPGVDNYFENKILVGVTSATSMSGNGLETSGSIRANGYITSTDLVGSGFRNVNTTASGNLTTSTSLRELKENIVTTSLGLDAVKALTPREFDWKDVAEYGTEDIGFIADEVFAVSPKLATYKEGDKTEANLQGVKYEQLTAVLVKAMQEQQTIIDDLKARIKTLEDA